MDQPITVDNILFVARKFYFRLIYVLFYVLGQSVQVSTLSWITTSYMHLCSSHSMNSSRVDHVRYFTEKRGG